MSRMPRVLSLLALGLLGGCFVSGDTQVSEQKGAYRLPESIRPETYRLELLTDLDPASNFSFVGVVKIKIIAISPTSVIQLHQKDLTIKNKEVTVKTVAGDKAVAVKSVEIPGQFDFLLINLETSLETGKEYLLTIPFDGKLKKNLNGYYRSNYINKDTGSTEWLAVTQFEPFYARQAFPCFDEPALKANFTIVLGHHNEYISASNMPVKDTKPVDGLENWVWNEFQESVRMSTYLVAYMVSKFKYLESDPALSKTKFRIWAPAHLIDQGKFASDVGPKFLTFFEDFFGITFPLPKQDMVAVPDFEAGAMENWGIITYRDTDLLYDDKLDSIFNKEEVSEGKLAGDVGPKILSFFEEYFGITFPLPKQDMVVVPDFEAGAMENWGFITYRDTALLYDDKLDSIFNKERVSEAKLAGFVGPQVLTYYEEFFNISFPLPKQDMVAIPDFASGAMENWGFITYRETALLFCQLEGSIYNKERVAEVVSHELAHQWFGNLVTMKWWSDLWLNEGFATYVAAIGMDHVFPLWKILEYEAVENFQLVLALDALKTSHSISVEIGNPNEIKQIFDTISYKKGAVLLRMMSKFLGDDVFRQGLHNYLTKHQYGNAEQDDLWSALTDEAKRRSDILPKDLSVKDIMDTWTKQTGYPILTVTRDYEKNTILVTQSRYLSGTPSKDDAKVGWWVPLSFVTKVSKLSEKPKDWLAPTEIEATEFALPSSSAGSWYLLNSELMALYRINYDQQNWDLIIKSLGDPEEYKLIPKLSRVQIMFDTMAFAKSGRINYSIPLKILSYLNHENDHLPLKTALSGLEHISNLLARTSDYGVFEKYGRKILVPQYKKTKEQYENRKPEDNEVIKKHITVNTWACKVKVPECEENAIQLFDKWMNEENPDQNNPIPAELRATTYCVAISRGSVKHWAFLWRRYQLAASASHKASILASLSCTRIIWLNKRYLEWTLRDGPEIRRQDAVIVFSSVAKSETGYYAAKAFLYSNIKEIYETVPDKDRIGNYVGVIGNQALDRNEHDEFLKFVDDNKQYMHGARLQIDQTLEALSINRKWRETYYDYVVKLLSELSN